MFCGDLVKAMGQLSHQILVSTHQQAADLVGDPSIVEQALSSGGRKRGRQRQLVQYCRINVRKYREKSSNKAEKLK